MVTIMALFLAATATALGFLAVGLMAYYATRSEKEGPRCPRCLNRVKPEATACGACKIALEQLPEER